MIWFNENHLHASRTIKNTLTQNMRAQSTWAFLSPPLSLSVYFSFHTPLEWTWAIDTINRYKSFCDLIMLLSSLVNLNFLRWFSDYLYIENCGESQLRAYLIRYSRTCSFLHHLGNTVNGRIHIVCTWAHAFLLVKHKQLNVANTFFAGIVMYELW